MYEAYTLGITVVVLNSHRGWNSIANGISKKFKLGLRGINGRLAFFMAKNESDYNIFKEEKTVTLGKCKVIIRHWVPDDSLIRNVTHTRFVDSVFWIGIRGLPFHFWELNSFKEICSPWGKVLEVHHSTVNFTKLNCCKVKVQATLAMVPAAVLYNDVWLSLEWMQDHLIDGAQAYEHANIYAKPVIRSVISQDTAEVLESDSTPVSRKITQDFQIQIVTEIPR